MIDNLINEIWMPVNGYEGFYEVSNMGRLKSLRRFINMKRGGGFWVDEKILKPVECKRGYGTYSLHKHGKLNAVKIHRLVAIHFIDNNENKPTVNHKNGAKMDNRVENLEWATQREQVIHSYHELRNNSLISNSRKAWESNSKKVRCNTLDVVFDSAADAAKAIGVDEKQVCKYINGSRSNRYGLTFSYI